MTRTVTIALCLVLFFAAIAKICQAGAQLNAELDAQDAALTAAGR